LERVRVDTLAIVKRFDYHLGTRSLRANADEAAWRCIARRLVEQVREYLSKASCVSKNEQPWIPVSAHPGDAFCFLSGVGQPERRLRSDCSTQRSRGENSIFPRASFSTSSRSSISRVRCPTCRWMIWSSRLFTSPAWRGCSGRVSPELAGFAARGLASPETRPLGPRRRLYRAYIAASWIHESQPSTGLWRWRSSECMAGNKATGIIEEFESTFQEDLSRFQAYPYPWEIPVWSSRAAPRVL
jgi:hypothetical protein